MLFLTVSTVSAAATCATPPAATQPATVFNCIGGICENLGATAEPICPRYDGAMGGGTPALFYTCSVANYYAELARYFGQLSFNGATIERTQTRYGEVSNVVLAWRSESNAKYQAFLQSVLPVGQCPSYWVLAAPPAHSEMSSAASVGRSINPASGNVHWTETDVEFPAAPGAIVFRRFYNSVDIEGLDGVPGWRHSYSRRIETMYQRPASAYPGPSSRVSARFSTPSAACTTGFAQIRAAVHAWADAAPSYRNGVCVLTRGSATIATLPIQAFPQPEPPVRPIEYDLIRDDGQVWRYTTQDGLGGQPGVAIRLAVTGKGFTVSDAEDDVEVYDSAGVLQSVTNRSGRTLRVTHDSKGRFSGVSEPFGNSLEVSRDAQGRIASLSTSGRGSLHYAYDDFSRLTTATDLMGAEKTYLYEDPLFFNALTSVVDGTGAIAAHWAYDSRERGTTTYASGLGGAISLAYGDEGGAVASTDALGSVQRFSYTRLGDIDQVTATRVVP